MQPQNFVYKSFSVYLDLLRFFAAITVFFYHIKHRNIGGSSILKFIPDLGHFAVILFFVLSGYLISASADRKYHLGIKQYMIDRASRIYSVALPALLFSLILSLLISKQNIIFDIKSILTNLIFMGQSWTNNLNPFLNTPYWSLCYEVMYYCIFGSLIFLKSWKKWMLTMIFLALAGPKILLLMPCWLFGVLIYKYRDIVHLGNISSLILGFIIPLIATMILFLGFGSFLGQVTSTLLGAYYADLSWSRWFISDTFIALIFAMHIYAMRHLLFNFTWPRVFVKLITAGAGMSFTLYLFHQPIIRLIDIYIEKSDRSIALFFISIIAIPTICYLISLLTEKRRPVFHRWLEKLILNKS